MVGMVRPGRWHHFRPCGGCQPGRATGSLRTRGERLAVPQVAANVPLLKGRTTGRTSAPHEGESVRRTRACCCRVQPRATRRAVAMLTCTDSTAMSTIGGNSNSSGRSKTSFTAWNYRPSCSCHDGYALLEPGQEQPLLYRMRKGTGFQAGAFVAGWVCGAGLFQAPVQTRPPS